MDKEKMLGIVQEIMDEALAIRCDWSDPRLECRNIMAKCKELKTLIGIDKSGAGKEQKDGE